MAKPPSFGHRPYGKGPFSATTGAAGTNYRCDNTPPTVYVEDVTPAGVGNVAILTADGSRILTFDGSQIFTSTIRTGYADDVTPATTYTDDIEV